MARTEARLTGRRSWLRRLAIGCLSIIALALIVGGLWWRAQGTAFFYGLIYPDSAQLLEGQEVPAVLDAPRFREDLRFLAREMPRRHVAFERAFDPEGFRAMITQLDRQAEALSPDARQVELLRVLASGGVGTGHTMILPFQRGLDWRIYPLSTYWFDDGLFITAADGKNQAAVGARIETLGGRPVAEALERLAALVAADNESSKKGMVPLLLSMVEPLIVLQLADPDGTLTLGLEGASEIRVEPVRLTSLRGLRWGRNLYAPVATAWSPADPRPRKRNFQLEHDSPSSTLLLRINAFGEDAGEPLGQLLQRLDDWSLEMPVERFVIDLRNNAGGNNELGRPLVDLISDHPVLDRAGRLYVAIGRKTFSAAGNFACDLERRTRAIFIGETSGFAPDHFGDAVSVLLPGSKIAVRLASRFWQEDLPDAGRRALEPDVAVPFLARDHFSGDDPVLRVLKNRPMAARPAAGLPPAGLAGVWELSPHRRVRVFEAEGRRRLAIDAVGTYAISDLYAGEEGWWDTDIRDVRLEVPASGVPTLWWKGTALPLHPTLADRALPLELLQSGEIAAGVKAFRAVTRPGELGSGFELAINRVGYDALGAGRVDEAVLAFTFCTELFPDSANSWDSLGDGLAARGESEAARAAYRRALAIDPLFHHAHRRLEELSD